MARGVLLGGKPKRGTEFRQGGQRRRARLALVGKHPGLVRVGRRVTDGEDTYAVKDKHVRVDGTYYHLVNELLPERNDWFKLEDMAELAVVLEDEKAVLDRELDG